MSRILTTRFRSLTNAFNFHHHRYRRTIIPQRQMANQAPQTHPSIRYSHEGAVIISYPSLKNDPKSLLPSIEKAFGSDPECLGLIVVEDLPETYVQRRKDLLTLADRFAALPEEVKEKYVDASSKYSFGWSHGKEIMNGKPDTLKGSYYANPIVDEPDVSEELKKQFPYYYGRNIWVASEERGMESFQSAFKSLGSFIFGVGLELAAACQPFASKHLSEGSMTLEQMIGGKSQTTKARLLHYFPPSQKPDSSAPDDSWCGTHLDNSMLTGLCSAMYLRHPTDGSPPVEVPPPASDAGLYIHTRGGEIKKVSIPPTALAFQTGEALELCTAGRLRATPHLVKAGAWTPEAASVSRETFALFMQPETSHALTAQETFGQFSERVFGEHYEKEDATS